MSELFMNMQHRRLHGTSNGVAANGQSEDTAEEEEDGEAGMAGELANMLSLKLKKPAHWKWELTTSRSCSNIAIPRILLYNHKGKLLVDASAQGEDQVYKAERPAERSTKRPQPAAEEGGAKVGRRKRNSTRAATTNLTHSIRQALNSEFNELHIKDAAPSPALARRSPNLLSPTSPRTASASPIDFMSNELPNYEVSRRSDSLRSVRFKVDDLKSCSSRDFSLVDLPTPPSTTTTGTASSSSGPREKRRYRRSRSSGRSSSAQSSSILERFSFNRGRFSSPESADEADVQQAPRYVLRTSRAGTLLVQEESFSRCRRRPRRPRNSSSETTLNDISSKSRSTSSLKITEVSLPELLVPRTEAYQTHSLGNIAELREPGRRMALPLRRHQSDGDFLLQDILSSAEELQDTLREATRAESFSGKSTKLRRRFSGKRSRGDVPSFREGLEGQPTERRCVF